MISRRRSGELRIAREDRVLALLDALGDLDLALAREERDAAHLAQVHADRVVRLRVVAVDVLLALRFCAAARDGLLARRPPPRRCASARSSPASRRRRSRCPRRRARPARRRSDRRDDVRRQRVVDLVVGEEALAACPELDRAALDFVVRARALASPSSSRLLARPIGALFVLGRSAARTRFARCSSTSFARAFAAVDLRCAASLRPRSRASCAIAPRWFAPATSVFATSPSLFSRPSCFVRSSSLSASESPCARA